MMLNRFAVMWDCDGLEAVASIRDFEQAKMWAILEGRAPPDVQPPNIMMWRLRAQVNPQRNYEIYIIEGEPDVTAEDIRAAFEASPQTMADTIRRNGHQFYSNRSTKERVIV
jgi:hypothetical protein